MKKSPFAAALLAGALVFGGATAAEAAPKHYASCAVVHKTYSGGIAKKSVHRNTIKHANGTKTYRALKGKVKYSTPLYNANKKLDRDKDGILCEKS